MNMNPEINLKLHNHVWAILNDLAIDETFSEDEANDIKDAMGDLAEMLIDSLNLEVVEVAEVGSTVELTVKLVL